MRKLFRFFIVAIVGLGFMPSFTPFTFRNVSYALDQDFVTINEEFSGLCQIDRSPGT